MVLQLQQSSGQRYLFGPGYLHCRAELFFCLDQERALSLSVTSGDNKGRLPVRTFQAADCVPDEEELAVFEPSQRVYSTVTAEAYRTNTILPVPDSVYVLLHALVGARGTEVPARPGFPKRKWAWYRESRLWLACRFKSAHTERDCSCPTYLDRQTTRTPSDLLKSGTPVDTSHGGLLPRTFRGPSPL